MGPGLGACRDCSRRAWLLGELSPLLDYRRGDRARLLALLALPDEQLIAALGGRRRCELERRHGAFEAMPAVPCEDGPRQGPRAEPPPGSERLAAEQPICRHDPRYPRSLRTSLAPHALHVAGPLDRCLELCAHPVVAILGSERPSDYGAEMAASLARGLTASGIAVAALLRPGVAAAVHGGALEAGGSPLAVCADGLAAEPPGAVRALHHRLAARGCLISELAGEVSGRGWGHLCAERILASLATVAVLVEAREDEAALATSDLARSLGCTVAALPGPLTSVLSAGPHALIAAGTPLIRGAGDVLELIARDSSATAGAPPRARHDGGSPGENLEPPMRQASEAVGTGRLQSLEPRLRHILEAVGAGRDTPEALAEDPKRAGEAMAALAELEVMGLLRRSAGGRYTLRDPPPALDERSANPAAGRGGGLLAAREVNGRAADQQLARRPAV
jgi:DNA processing protein